MSIRDYEKEFNYLLECAICLVGGEEKRVVVLLIPDYGYTLFGKVKQSIVSREIDYFNGVNQEMASCFGVHYMNIIDISC